MGVYSTRNNLFDVGIVAVFGILGAIFLSLDFPVSPIVLGFVLGPMLEENFRRAMLLSRGNISVFIERPISAWFIGACSLLIVAQIWSYARKVTVKPPIREAGELVSE